YLDKPHHTSDGFRNVNMSEQPSFFDFLKWRWGRLWKKIPGPEAYDFPLGKNDPAFLRSNHDKITLTWIGHATVLLQLKGKNILTDPHFSKRASPLKWAGPRRVVAPGLTFEDLPLIDMVIISHNHYDSLDKRTIMKLYEREGGQKTTFFVPLGLKSWFQGLGINRVFELDWWDQHDEKNLKIIAVPMQHWSSRSFFSQNKSLWGGWVIRSTDFRFFFAGDSGYNLHFKEIGRKLGPFDLSVIPIGAYEPRWFMRYHHITPEEALQVHFDVRSKKSLAIHWGTFILTDEPLDEPPKRLKKVIKEKRLSNDGFLVLRHGETILLN
ncbi:MAG: MBL fold metallo-hydrolase, partial [Desulfatiglandales bacterium]|nr:MBL fold metallo-hydrolase [Desulfatiglandales bacterium]